jgi:N-acetylglucosamine kinase-like BadF-type ATPase
MISEIITGTAITPATVNLFDVRPEHERKVLGEEQARAFHHSVAQLLLATTRARKDIQHTVAFLTTRVKSPDEDDWMKLKRLLKYTRGTIYMPLILKADSLNIVKRWVDASHATHGDCKGHTGATMSMGTGSITGILKKQKINTRSST